MNDWMTIRVVLTRQAEAELPQPPGRVLLAHTEHSFSDLAEAIDVAFGRWDLTPLNSFEVEGRVLASEPDDDAEDWDDVTLGDVGLRGGARFTYVFDLGEGWSHECTVEEVGVDPFDLVGEGPDVPVPVFGWGYLPDQYGRLTEDGDEPVGSWEDTAAEDERDEEAYEDERYEDWDAEEHASWAIVDEAIADVERHPDRDALAEVTARLRTRGGDDWTVDVLWAAADVDPDNPPDADEELWIVLAAGVVAPREGVPLDADRTGAWAALERADWAGAVIELVRAGPGAAVTPDAVLELIAACPEVEEADLSPEGRETLLTGLEVVIALWRFLGVAGPDGLLTPLGHWGLPEALAEAWEGQEAAEV